jgi:hypothetical protein
VIANEKPITWKEWKEQHPRFLLITSIEWGLRKLRYLCHESATIWFIEVTGWIIAIASVFVVILVWIYEAEDRKKQKHYRAWELINSAIGSSGDGGRRRAIQDLYEDGVILAAAPFSKAYLVDMKLPGVVLWEADLSGARLGSADLKNKAILNKANLSGADLKFAELNGAVLDEANLSNANLRDANLNGATLIYANLNGVNLYDAELLDADLRDANLRDADLRDASLRRANMTGANLENAKFCETIMPDGTVNNRDCPPEPTPPNPSETPPAPN